MMQVTVESALNPGMEAEFEKASALMHERIKAYDGFLGNSRVAAWMMMGGLSPCFAGVTGKPSKRGTTIRYTSRSSDWAGKRSLPGTASAWPRSSGNTATTSEAGAAASATEHFSYNAARL